MPGQEVEPDFGILARIIQKGLGPEIDDVAFARHGMEGLGRLLKSQSEGGRRPWTVLEVNPLSLHIPGMMAFLQEGGSQEDLAACAQHTFEPLLNEARQSKES